MNNLDVPLQGDEDQVHYRTVEASPLKFLAADQEHSCFKYVGSGRVTILPDFGGSGRVGSGKHFGFFYFFTDYILVPGSIWIFEY